jgi:protein-S-isoprenylcysteine O-methyltransferase Ste14
LGFVFAVFYLWRARPSWLSLGWGTAIVLLGLFLRAVASGHVKKNEELTQTGPYAHVRNPLYVGSIIIAVGFAIAARDVWIARVMVLMFILIYVPVIRAEEIFLRRQFAEYDDYARRVPRLVPHTLWLSGATTGFARELYFRHREYNALIGAAAMLAALVVKILWFTR